MLPFDSIHGYLPDGVHTMSLARIESELAWNATRRWLAMGLFRAAHALRHAGCRTLVLDGSFATAKERPGDWDAAFDPTGVDGDALDPILLRHTDGRRAMKAKYLGDVFPWGARACPKTGAVFRDFFRTDRDGVPKGVIEIKLDQEP